MVRNGYSRFVGVVDDAAIAVHTEALRVIKALSPSTLRCGIERARSVGGSTKRAVLYFGIMDAAFALERDDTLMDPEKAWDVYSTHVATLAQRTYDNFVHVL
tara:strand:- start:71 stop:376 length:306 start_codon:yes stop_codon:yes gene_type:complete